MANVIRPDEELVHVTSKTVSHYDRFHKLALPVSLLGFVWTEGVPHEGVREFTILDVYGVPWRFVCRLRRTAIGGYPQPEVFGQGWRDFIDAKEIQVEDELAFYLPPPNLPEPRPVFVISVKREVRLFDRYMIGHVPL